MKPLLSLCLILSIILCGAPLMVRADVATEIFALPDGRAAEAYQTNIEAVLRDTYRLKIETETRPSILQWAFVDGEMPPGVILRTDGTINGTPKASRSQPFRFRVKAFDAVANGAEPLVLELSLSIAAPQIRLTKITGPTLTPADAPNNVGDANSAAAVGERVSTAAAGRTSAAPASETSGTSGGGDALGAPVAAQADNCPGCTAASCPQCSPQIPDSERKIVIDARTGSVEGSRKYRRGQHAQVVIVNKNPYIRAYTIKIDETQLPETALNTFLPLLSSIIADQISPPKDTKDKDAASKQDANAANNKAANDQKAGLMAAGPPPCPDQNELNDLIGEKNKAMAAASALKSAYEPLATKHKAVAADYKAGVDTLSGTHASCNVLYCTSLTLRDKLEHRVSDASIEAAQEASNNLKTRANDLKLDTAIIRKKYQDCPLPLLDDYDAIANDLLNQAKEVDASLGKIKDDNKKFEKATETINNVLTDESSFAEVHEIPQKRSTDITTVTLSAKGLKSFGGEPEDKSNDIAKVEVQFGDAPYFALSGGLAFSTLEKTEFQRVQGFATNRQGEITGTELTSIVGVKEDSSTRITPMLMLHGRLYRPNEEKWGFSGLHWSLGITGKNDNKGTDIEYLVGPSASFLNDQLFFTVGGYAGKQQTLDGNLFPGAEVPKDLAEIPVHKNYHWKLGFALTYKLPVFK